MVRLVVGSILHCGPRSEVLDGSSGRSFIVDPGARCSSVVRAFARDAMGRRVDPSLCPRSEV